MSQEPLVLPLDEHNRALLANVHPADWANPVPHQRYNLVVIGGGPAGLVAAAGAAGLGARVALVERGLNGGDCLNVGCVPSKALLRSARALHDAAGVEGFGAKLRGQVEPDFAAAMERLRRLRAELSAVDSLARFRALGVHVFLGSGRFLAEDAVEVAETGAKLRFDRAVVATGARNFLPPVPGLREIDPLTNENLFWLTELPRRIVMVGAGPIGCELGQALRRFGAELSFVSLDPRVLPRDDPDASAVLARALAREGVRLELGAKLTRAERRGSDKVVHFAREADGAAGEIVCDEVVVAIGRSPNVEGLGLELAGIQATREGVVVDDRLRTTNPRVYAAGDVCTAFKFTHAADEMARIVIGNALFHGRRRVSKLVIPWVTYTDPEVAHVGLYESEAKERSIDVDTLTLPLAEVDRALLDGDTQGFARVHLEHSSDRILGATIVARHAGELIAEVGLAMTKGLGLGAIAGTIHAYPTQAAAWKRLGDQRNRERLKPWMRALMQRWFAWRLRL